MLGNRLARQLYNYLPFKYQLYRQFRSFLKLPHCLYQHLQFNEHFSVNIDSSNSLLLYNRTCIENEIFWNGVFGSWEQSSLLLWTSLCKVCHGAIFDIGANNGVYSLIAAASTDSSTIHAFEPHPTFYSNLVDHISLNMYDDRIKSIPLAISDTSNDSQIADYAKVGNYFNAKCISFDRYCESYVTCSVDLIKVDIEGMEMAFFAGAMKTLKKHRPTIIIEILDGCISKEQETYLLDLGYSFFTIDDNTLSPPTPVSTLRSPLVLNRNYLLLGSLHPLRGRTH